MGIHTQSQEIAFSLNTQADIKTTIADAALDRLRPIETYAPFTVQMTRINDAAWFGKGHTFSTFAEKVGEDTTIPSVTHPMTDIEALWAFYFVMGGLASVKPNTPTTEEWQHTITWLNILTQQNPPYTTLLEEYSGGTSPGYRKKLIGAFLQQVTLSFGIRDFVKIAVQGMGREYVTEATATPPAAVTAGSYFKTPFITLALGPTAAPDISTRVVGGNLVFNNNARAVARPGQPAGEEFLMDRAAVGGLGVSGTLDIEAHTTDREYFLGQTLIEAVLTCTSQDNHVGAAAKTVVITIPNIKLGDSESFSTDTETMIWQAQIGEGSAMKIGAAEQVSVVITADEDNLKLGIDSP